MVDFRPRFSGNNPPGGRGAFWKPRTLRLGVAQDENRRFLWFDDHARAIEQAFVDRGLGAGHSRAVWVSPNSGLDVDDVAGARR